MDYGTNCESPEPFKPDQNPAKAVLIWRGGATERYEVFGEAGNGMSAVCADEVKLIRAQGECLGIRNR